MAKLTPDDADRLFSSRVDETDPDLGSLAAFVRDARDAYGRAPDAATQARHLRAMAEAYTAGPVRTPVARPRRLARRAAIGGLAASLFLGGSALAAATGHLPGPAQNAVANAVAHIGLNVPTAGDSSETGEENGDAGKARAGANKDRAKAFTDAKKEWTECVAEKAREHTGPGPFDPEAPKPEGCGPKPKQQDYQPTRTNPAGQENHGKGPEPKGAGPENAGPDANKQHGNPNATASPAANPAQVGPGNSGSHGQGTPASNR